MATHFKGPVISENGFEGAIVGDITGDIVGNVTGNVTGNLTGNVTGNVTGNLAGNQSGGSIAATTATVATSLAVGASGAVIKKIGSGLISLTISALGAGAEEDLSALIADVAAGDILVLMPPAAAAETGMSVAAVWASAGAANVRISNLNAVAALTGGANDWTYLWIDLT